MKLFLNCDVKGPFSQALYGKKGDEVRLVADHGDMLIVEVHGKRWPVLRSEVSETMEEPSIIEEEKPQPVNHPSKVKTKKAKQTIVHQTLF